MKKRYLIFSFAIIFLLTGCYENTSQKIDASVDNQIESKEEIIYEKNDGIQKFLSLYNKLFPNDSIQKDMITTYYHHGREHDDQIQFTLDGNQITLSNSYSANNQYNMSVVITNNMNNNDIIKNITFRFMKTFNSALTDDELNGYWDEESKNNFPNKKELDGITYNIKTKVSSNEIEYLTINGSINIT